MLVLSTAGSNNFPSVLCLEHLEEDLYFQGSFCICGAAHTQPSDPLRESFKMSFFISSFSSLVFCTGGWGGEGRCHDEQQQMGYDFRDAGCLRRSSLSLVWMLFIPPPETRLGLNTARHHHSALHRSRSFEGQNGISGCSRLVSHIV